MRTIIAGSRHFTGLTIVDMDNYIKHSGISISTVLCGQAKGIDTLGEQWALANHIPIEYYPANWELHGKAAGFLRNQQMAVKAEQLILIWDSISKGSSSMLKLAKQHNLIIHEVRLREWDRVW